ncbi:MAG: hypothetical protein HGA80_05995 [Candidatus Omnitrophica bacterium]|nr:hypothetical protein [Candidatus Omnitrophota bacterium]
MKLAQRVLAGLLLIPFLLNTVVPPALAAQMPWMSQPGEQVALSARFTPAYLCGMSVHPNEPFNFDFLVHRGDEDLPADRKQDEYARLIKYFLAALAVPDADQWVNLSPYEKDRMIPDNFGLTEMGRDLLAQDYMLKQLTSSLTAPDNALGNRFWDHVYAEARRRFGTAQVPTDVFSKVWIVPDKAVVFEKNNTVYVLESHMKVMTERDHMAMQKNAVAGSEAQAVADISSQVLKEVVIPALEREVNEGRGFATLRQVFSGMLLATWYKRTLKGTILGQLYADRGKVSGIDQDPQANQEIYGRYVQAFHKGAYNMIREDVDHYTREVVPRKYFSGGAENRFDTAMTVEKDSGALKKRTADWFMSRVDHVRNVFTLAVETGRRTAAGEGGEFLRTAIEGLIAASLTAGSFLALFTYFHRVLPDIQSLRVRSAIVLSASDQQAWSQYADFVKLAAEGGSSKWEGETYSWERNNTAAPLFFGQNIAMTWQQRELLRSGYPERLHLIVPFTQVAGGYGLELQDAGGKRLVWLDKGTLERMSLETSPGWVPGAPMKIAFKVLQQNGYVPSLLANVSKVLFIPVTYQGAVTFYKGYPGGIQVDGGEIADVDPAQARAEDDPAMTHTTPALEAEKLLGQIAGLKEITLGGFGDITYLGWLEAYLKDSGIRAGYVEANKGYTLSFDPEKVDEAIDAVTTWLDLDFSGHSVWLSRIDATHVRIDILGQQGDLNSRVPGLMQVGGAVDKHSIYFVNMNESAAQVWEQMSNNGYSKYFSNKDLPGLRIPASSGKGRVSPDVRRKLVEPFIEFMAKYYPSAVFEAVRDNVGNIKVTIIDAARGGDQVGVDLAMSSQLDQLEEVGLPTYQRGSDEQLRSGGGFQHVPLKFNKLFSGRNVYSRWQRIYEVLGAGAGIWVGFFMSYRVLLNPFCGMQLPTWWHGHGGNMFEGYLYTMGASMVINEKLKWFMSKRTILRETIASFSAFISLSGAAYFYEYVFSQDPADFWVEFWASSAVTIIDLLRIKVKSLSIKSGAANVQKDSDVLYSGQWITSELYRHAFERGQVKAGEPVTVMSETVTGKDLRFVPVDVDDYGLSYTLPGDSKMHRMAWGDILMLKLEGRPVSYPQEKNGGSVPAIGPGQVVPGGIDFAQSNLDMQIKRDGNGVVLPVSQQDLENIHIDGLVPVILDIRPASSVPSVQL